MKHSGARDDLLQRPGADKTSAVQGPGPSARQSRVSLAVSAACALFLVAVLVDPAVRDLARSLDASLVAALRTVTEFGNSAWSLGIGLFLLACVTLASRQNKAVAADALRSMLLLMVGSVALSGALASLAKNIIGRVRPSTGPDAQVLDFAVLSFRAGWASFPSGHATTATALALALAISFPRQSWAWLAIGLVAALSRALLGVHWLTDCLAGMALGAAVTLALRSWLAGRGHRFEADLSVLPRVIFAAGTVLITSMLHLGRKLVNRVT